jgi:hypothetical protein
VQLVNETRAKERRVELPASFTEQPTHTPVAPKPSNRGSEVDLPISKPSNFRTGALKAFDAMTGRRLRHEHDERRESFREDPGTRIHGGRTAGDNAQIVFCETTSKSPATEPGGTRAKINRGRINGASPAHDGVDRGAKFVEVKDVAAAAEAGDGAIGRGDLAIGGHGHVDQDERPVAWHEAGLGGASGGSGFHRINMASP